MRLCCAGHSAAAIKSSTNAAGADPEGNICFIRILYAVMLTAIRGGEIEIG